MAFRCVQGPDTAIPKYCGTSSSVVAGALCVYDRSAGTVILATASTLALNTAGVASNTPASSDTYVNIIPIAGDDQIWEWDCTNNTAVNQLNKRSVLTDASTVANTSTDQTSSGYNVVVPISNIGVAGDKRQRGNIVRVAAAVS